MPDFLVFYTCTQAFDPPGLPPMPVMRAVTETDLVNAIITARREERTLIGHNCSGCTLATVRLIGGSHAQEANRLR